MRMRPLQVILKAVEGRGAKPSGMPWSGSSGATADTIVPSIRPAIEPSPAAEAIRYRSVKR